MPAESIAEALDRLKAAHLDVSDLEADFERMSASRAFGCDAECISLLEKITKRARLRQVTSRVHVETTKKGAIIRYQTLGERVSNDSAWTMKAPTPCSEELPIGVYYLWAERQGRSTSDRDLKFRLIHAEETVRITER